MIPLRAFPSWHSQESRTKPTQPTLTLVNEKGGSLVTASGGANVMGGSGWFLVGFWLVSGWFLVGTPKMDVL